MPATNSLLSRMIEYTGNVIIGSAGLDMLIPTNGTLLVLQNVTWGGVQGFQQRPAKPASPAGALRIGFWKIFVTDDKIVLLAVSHRPDTDHNDDGRCRRHLGPRARLDILRSQFGRTRAAEVSLRTCLEHKR